MSEVPYTCTIGTAAGGGQRAEIYLRDKLVRALTGEDAERFLDELYSGSRGGDMDGVVKRYIEERRENG